MSRRFALSVVAIGGASDDGENLGERGMVVHPDASEETRDACAAETLMMDGCVYGGDVPFKEEILRL